MGHGNRTTLGWKCHTRAVPSCDIFNLGFVIFPCPTHYRASSVKCQLIKCHCSHLLLNAELLCAVLLQRPAATTVSRYLLPARPQRHTHHSGVQWAIDRTDGHTGRQILNRSIDPAAYYVNSVNNSSSSAGVCMHFSCDVLQVLT